jgi:uncharacterized membrane protein YdjX (TVP38/TMEM64 family)
MPYRGAPSRVPPSGARFRSAVVVGIVVTALLFGLCIWLVVSNAPVYRFLMRLYLDKDFMGATLRQWGVLAPIVFIVIQALQVIIAPIPGEVTGLLGGFVFGQWLGFFYSTVGLTAGSLFAFWIGRRLGAPYVRQLVSAQAWERMGFIVEAEGAILCFVIYLIPGLPKDIVCYLFGLSPMPFWVFGVVSTIGRAPGTWALSAQGAKAAAGEYIELLLLTAVIVAIALPLYYYRSRIVSWLQRRPS